MVAPTLAAFLCARCTRLDKVVGEHGLRIGKALVPELTGRLCRDRGLVDGDVVVFVVVVKREPGARGGAGRREIVDGGTSVEVGDVWVGGASYEWGEGLVVGGMV